MNYFDIKVYKEEDWSFFAEVINLPWCFTRGETIKDLEENIEEAIKLYMLNLKKELDENHINLTANNLIYV